MVFRHDSEIHITTIYKSRNENEIDFIEIDMNKSLKDIQLLNLNLIIEYDISKFHEVS